MKKLAKMIILLLMSVFLVSCFDNEEKIANKIKANLKTKYGEEFVLYGLGKRKMGNGRSWYECRIIPAKYVDTPKFLDDYYWAKGFYSNGNPGDSYGLVKLKESMNDFYGSKVEEIFGPNHLMLMEYNGSPDFYNWEDKLSELNELYVSQEEYYKELNIVPSYEPITGGIYIFTRINNDYDKEIYRKKIFKFIEFMKEKKSFEYVDLSFYIIDERCLTIGFETDIGYKLMLARQELETADEFIEYRSKLLSTLDEEYDKMSEKEKVDRIDYLDKSSMKGWDKRSIYYYSRIYHKTIRSPKFLIGESRLSMYKIINYNRDEDLVLLNTIRILYHDYDENKIYNNEGVD